MSFFERLWANEDGTSLISVVMDVALLSIGALVLASLVTAIRVDHVRMARKGNADSSLEGVSFKLQNLEFRQLYDVCLDRGVLNSSRTSICRTVDSKLASGPAVGPGTEAATQKPKIVDLIYNWSGTPSPDGAVCIELARCQERAQGRLLEVTLRATLLDPGAPDPRSVQGVPQTLVFRKAR